MSAVIGESSPGGLSGDPVVWVRDLDLFYGSGAAQVQALVAVDLAVARGEMVVLRGVSGSGKSTLINVLGGLLAPSSGTVLVDGLDLGSASADELARYRRTASSIIFQEFNLLSMLRVWENVALPAELSGTHPVKARRSATAVLAKMGLEDLADRFPGELSGGQRQRVAIARALLDTRAVLLADEPTGSLDSRTTRLVVDGLLAARDSGVAVVVATHDDAVAERGDRVLHVVDGQVVDGAAMRR